MAYCPSVCRYKVVFSDGTIMYPNLPGHANVYMVADQYARETLSKKAGKPVHVVSVESIL